MIYYEKDELQNKKYNYQGVFSFIIVSSYSFMHSFLNRKKNQAVVQEPVININARNYHNLVNKNQVNKELAPIVQRWDFWSAL